MQSRSVAADQHSLATSRRRQPCRRNSWLPPRARRRVTFYVQVTSKAVCRAGGPPPPYPGSGPGQPSVTHGDLRKLGCPATLARVVGLRAASSDDRTTRAMSVGRARRRPSSFRQVLHRLQDRSRPAPASQEQRQQTQPRRSRDLRGVLHRLSPRRKALMSAYDRSRRTKRRNLIRSRAAIMRVR